MKKNTKFAENAKKRIAREKELERLSNKELIVFTCGLVAEIVLMFFYSALKSAVAVKAGWTLVVLSGVFMAGFIALLVSGIVLAKKGDKKAASLKNWSFLSLAASLSALLISSGRIIAAIAEKTGWDLSVSWGRFFVYGQYQPKSMAVYFMIAVAVYVIAAMIYFGVKSYKVKKG